MMRRILRFMFGVLLPAILILGGILFQTGCFFVPTFNRTSKGMNVAAKVGDANSHRPIRVGFATREQIIAMFGKPPYSDDTGRRVGYGWSVQNGVWVFPLCFGGEPVIGDRGIELDFDQHDILSNFHIVAADRQNIMGLGETPDHDYERRPPLDQSLHPNNDDLNRQRNSN